MAVNKHSEVDPATIGITKYLYEFVKFLNKISIGRYIQPKNDPIKRVIYADAYTVTKTVLPLAFLCLYKTSGIDILKYLAVISCYSILETIGYVCFQIFQVQSVVRVRSATRNVLLGIFNYIQLTFDFALIYAVCGNLKMTTSVAGNNLNIIDYLYFSFTTGSTVGFGDIVATGSGHLIVIFQIFLFVIFVAVFLTYNISLFISNQ